MFVIQFYYDLLQEVQLQKLRELYEESMTAQRWALQEKEQLQSELCKARATMRVCMSNISVITVHLFIVKN